MSMIPAPLLICQEQNSRDANSAADLMFQLACSCPAILSYMPKQQILQGGVTTRAVLATRAARRIEKLRTAALELEAHHAETIAATAPAMNKSARNMVHYLAVRANDI